MNIKKSLSIVVCFTVALVGAQYVWAKKVQEVSIVDQKEAVTVRVKNTPAVQIAPKEPVQWQSEQLGINQFALFPVPDGKRLVIESVWFAGGTDAEPLSSIVGFSVRTTVDGNTVEHRFNPGMPLGPAGGFGRTYLVDKQLRLYADPNTELGLIGLNSNSIGEYTAGFSGYYVKAP